MKKKVSKTSPFSLKNALLASIMVSVILNVVLVLGVFYGRSRAFIADIPGNWSTYLTFFLWHLGCNVVLFFLLFILNFDIVKSKRKYGNWIASIGTILICGILSPPLTKLQWFVLGGSPDAALGEFIMSNMVKDVLVGTVVIIITQTINMTYKREQTLLANQKLKEENFRIKYEALKNQLDPHFLFNTLNALDSLICDNDEQAHEYLDNLSSVFRYTLHSKNIVTVEEEMEFTDAYVSLLRIRFGNNLQVDYSIESRYRHFLILPASLQLLVENAVKHNMISNEFPLKISIANSSKEDRIIVRNPIRPKTEKSVGGIGLANLIDRYSLAFNRDVIVSDTGGFFSVEVPVIEPSKNQKI